MIELIIKLTNWVSYKGSYVLALSSEAVFHLKEEIEQRTNGAITELPKQILRFDWKQCFDDGIVIRLEGSSK